MILTVSARLEIADAEPTLARHAAAAVTAARIFRMICRSLGLSFNNGS